MSAGLLFAKGFTSLTSEAHIIMSKYLKEYDITTRAGLEDLRDKIKNDDNKENNSLLDMIDGMLSSWQENISLTI